MPLLDGRPPAVDTRFRPGNTFTLTLNWPAGALTGRTFTAALDATALTLNVAGDVMTVLMSEAQTTAAANVGEFALTETTGGITDVVIVGSWHSSNGPSAGESTVVSVNESSGVVMVTTSGVSSNEAGLIAEARVAELPTLENGTRTTVDESTPGQVKVQIPATTAEVRDAQPFSPVTNRTDEVTVFTEAFGANQLVAGSVVNFLLMAGYTNNSGSASNLTLRLKCNGTTVWTMTFSAVPSGAGERSFYADLPATLGDFGGTRVFGRGRYSLSNPALETVYADFLTTASVAGTVPATAHDWVLTAQHSVAHANISFIQSVGQVLYRP